MNDGQLTIFAGLIVAILALALAFAAGWLAALRAAGPGCVGPACAPLLDLEGRIPTRIAMADVRERLRRLEAIADGIDL